MSVQLPAAEMTVYGDATVDPLAADLVSVARSAGYPTEIEVVAYQSGTEVRVRSYSAPPEVLERVHGDDALEITKCLTCRFNGDPGVAIYVKIRGGDQR